MLLNKENSQEALEAGIAGLVSQGLSSWLLEGPIEIHILLLHPSPKSSLFLVLSSRGFHNNNIKAIPEKAFMGNPLLQTM